MTEKLLLQTDPKFDRNKIHISIFFQRISIYNQILKSHQDQNCMHMHDRCHSHLAQKKKTDYRPTNRRTNTSMQLQNRQGIEVARVEIWLNK